MTTKQQQDIGFYAFNYFEDHARFMVWDKEKGDKPRLGLEPGDVAKSGYQKGFAISKSLLVHHCRPGVGLDNIHFSVEDSWYEPPWMLRKNGLSIIEDGVGGFTPKHYNGTTLSVKGATIIGKHIDFSMQKSCYFNHLLTNHLADTMLDEGITHRQILEPGPSLNDLSESMADNHLGLSCMMQTTDGYFLIPKRSHRVGIFPNLLSPSVTGAANMSACRDDRSGYSARAWLITEIIEELPFLQDDRGRVDHRLVDMGSVRVLGMTRELIRCGKPELFMAYDLPVDKQALLGFMGSPDLKSVGRDNGHVDHVENERFLLVHEDEVFDTLSEVISSANGRPAEYPVITHENEAYQLSESLLSNLLLHRMSMR